LEQRRIELHAELKMLFERRSSLKTDHILMRDQVSTICRTSRRWWMASRAHGCEINEILATLMQLRPEQLAQLIQSNDLDSFEELTHFGSERSRKILDAFRESVDPLAREITAIEDRIGIELNVTTAGQPHFKGASDLSRGQKCTGLLVPTPQP
jgi:hypothetical protein